MSFTTVKKELNKLDKAKLIALMGDLYKKHKNVQEYLDHFADPDERGLLFHTLTLSSSSEPNNTCNRLIFCLYLSQLRNVIGS